MKPCTVAKRISAVAIFAISFVGIDAFAEMETNYRPKDWSAEGFVTNADVVKAYQNFQAKKQSPAADMIAPLAKSGSDPFLNIGMAGSFGFPPPGYAAAGYGYYGPAAEAQKPITPLITKGGDPLQPLREKMAKAERDLMAREDNYDILSSDIKDRQLTIQALERTIAKEKESGKPATKLVADLSKELAEMQQFRQAYFEAHAAKNVSFKELGAIQKEIDGLSGQSQGWYLADSTQSKALAKKEGFQCADGERMATKPGWGLYNWSCLNSKGLMTRQVNRHIGMAAYDVETVFEREGDKLTKTIVKGRDGKTISETTFGAKEQTMKIYSGDSLSSSCTTFVDVNSAGTYKGGGDAAVRGTTR